MRIVAQCRIKGWSSVLCRLMKHQGIVWNEYPSPIEGGYIIRTDIRDNAYELIKTTAMYYCVKNNIDYRYWYDYKVKALEIILEKMDG